MSATPPTTEPVGKTDLLSWVSIAQPGELRFYAQHPPFDVEAFVAGQWARFGFARDAFAGQVLIDLGCGPTVQAAWFTGVKRLIAIDPLAVRYSEHVPWNRLHLAHKVYTYAAEERIKAIVGKADALISRNALDHGFDFGQSARNIAAYLKPSGFAFISVDCHEPADPLHQMRLTPDHCESCYAAAGLLIEKHATSPAHGHGQSHQWWLRKQDCPA